MSKLVIWSCCWLTKVFNGHLKSFIFIWSHFLIKIRHSWLTTVISWLSKVISINIYRSESLPFRYIYTSLIACTLRLGLPLCHPHQCLWRISTSWYLIFCYYIKKYILLWNPWTKGLSTICPAVLTTYCWAFILCASYMKASKTHVTTTSYYYILHPGS